MKEFYYQIKGKKGEDQSSLSNWVFPPIFSGKVVAKDKKEAKEIVNEEYGKNFPSRVLKTDLDSNEFLLSIEEMKEGTHFHELFEKRACEFCNKSFYLIDKYNDQNTTHKGYSFCSDKCRELSREADRAKRNENEALIGSAVPVIYKITNKVTNMVYIGKTSQVFTLRWYQHFFQTGGNKFHDAIKKSHLSDWVFEIQEVIYFPENIRENKDLGRYLDDREKYISERERHWINEYDSIANGYNSV